MLEKKTFRSGVNIETLTCVDIEEIVKFGGSFLTVYDGFSCEILDFDPYESFVQDMIGKRT